MRKLSFYLIITLLGFQSCKKDDPEICPPTPAIPQYLPMTVGDYWVYEVFGVDSSGQDSSLGRFDSVYISTDTLIDGETYFVFRGTFYPIKRHPNSLLEIVRNHNGDLITSDGITLFSSTNYTDTLQSTYQTMNDDTIYHGYILMDDQVTQYTVPHGTHSSLIANHTFEFKDGWSPINPRVYPYVYGENIGLISTSISYTSTSSHMERRLIRASVTP